MDSLLLAGGIFVLRIVGNMITTVRLVTIVRGQKIVSTWLGVIEALVFALALGTVVSNLNNIPNLTAYCLGYGIGGYLGMVLEDQLVQKFVAVQVISPAQAHDVAVAIREAGFGATEGWGMGAEGQVGSVTAVVVHHDVNRVLQTVKDCDPNAFITLDELRGISQGYIRRFTRHAR